MNVLQAADKSAADKLLLGENKSSATETTAFINVDNMNAGNADTTKPLQRQTTDEIGEWQEVKYARPQLKRKCDSPTNYSEMNAVIRQLQDKIISLESQNKVLTAELTFLKICRLNQLANENKSNRNKCSNDATMETDYADTLPVQPVDTPPARINILSACRASEKKKDVPNATKATTQPDIPAISTESREDISSILADKGASSESPNIKHQTPHSIIMERLSSTYDAEDIKDGLLNLDINLEVLRGAIPQHDSEHWISFLKGITMNERAYGKDKAAAGIRRSTIPALSDDNGTAIYIDEDKANIIADSIQGMITAPRPQDGSINIIEQEFNIRSPLGASGSFKLSASASKELKAKTAEKKKKAPAAGDKKKKAAAPKKAAGEKKAAAKKPSDKKTAEKKKADKTKAKAAKKTGTVKAKPAKTAAKASATKPKAPKAKTAAAKPKNAAAAKKPAARKAAANK
ncbi:uncharacterized protein LOC131805102 [Musca domestica]|uniref:Uncharacterized protein LOC131805102 n=1 Tax=Musca domestica TaxID=7370 RepID=A0ABM3VEW6_MUSDO|nr:uncharacterized protein LOC131805102 [Musca domestica]